MPNAPPEANGLASRRAHNALQPVSRVPFEITTSIFRLLAFEYPLGRELEYGVINLGWVPTATHVCHQWRAHALADPGLWALCVGRVPVPRVFEALLPRTKDKPLHLTNMHMRDRALFRRGSSLHPGARVPEHFYSNFHNTRSLALTLDLGDAQNWANLIMAEGIPPMLHTLQLAMEDHPQEMECTEFLLSRIRENNLPHESLTQSNLQHVLFRNFFVPFSAQNLLSLRLCTSYEDRTGRAFKLPAILDMLAVAVSLESLWICHWTCDIPAGLSLPMHQLLELILAGPTEEYTRFHMDILLCLDCPRLKTLSCDGAMSRYFHPSASFSELRRVLAALRISDDHFRGASSTYSLNIWGRHRYTGEYTCTLRMGDITHDESLDSIIGPRTVGTNKGLREPRMNSPGERVLTSRHDTSALRALSEFAFYDVDFGLLDAANVFQSIAMAHASQHEDHISAVETLHFGTYFSTEGVDWPAILAHFTSARMLILTSGQSGIFQEDGIFAAIARAAAGGRLLLPSLDTIRTDQRVPWRARDVSALRACIEARAACGASPFCIRPREMVQWTAPVLKYFDGLVESPVS